LARRGVALGAAVFAISASARADPVHHNEVLVGGRALGMGGAATGLAEDAASVYYNPAGIAQMGGSSLSASFQVQALQKITVDHGLQAAGLADLKHDEKPSQRTRDRETVNTGSASRISVSRIAGGTKKRCRTSAATVSSQSAVARGCRRRARRNGALPSLGALAPSDSSGPARRDGAG